MNLPLVVRKVSSSLLTCLFLSCLSLEVYAADAIVTEGEALLKSGDSNAAYALLEPLESEKAGDPEFDYLFGLASLDSGHPSRAMFALERVLAVNPNHLQARAEIARAHFMLGELDTARVEFKNVLDQSPPVNAISTINRYLSVIARESGERTRFGAYLEATWGYDSNVNSAPSPGQFIANIGGIPLPVNLSDASAKTSSNFFTMGGGANFQHPFTSEITVLGSVGGTNRVNLSSDDAELFDTSSIDFSLGVRYQKGAETLTAAWQDNNFDLNGERFRHSYGLSAQWQHNLDDRNQLSLFGQFMRLEYPNASVRDADRRVLGVGYGHAFSGDLSPVLFLSGYVGEEDERHSNFSFLGHDLWGVRGGGQVTITPKTVLFASGGYENRDWGGQRPFFNKSQEDHQYDVTVGARFLPISRWQIKPQLTYVNSDSNIPITNYDRYMLSVTFRHEFEW